MNNQFVPILLMLFGTILFVTLNWRSFDSVSTQSFKNKNFQRALGYQLFKSRGVVTSEPETQLVFLSKVCDQRPLKLESSETTYGW